MGLCYVVSLVGVHKGLAARGRRGSGVGRSGLQAADDVRCRCAASKLVILDTQQDAAVAAAASGEAGSTSNSGRNRPRAPARTKQLVRITMHSTAGPRRAGPGERWMMDARET